MSPAYKIGDVVQLKGHYSNAHIENRPMIVLDIEDDTGLPLGQHCYKLLQGDNKVFRVDVQNLFIKSSKPGICPFLLFSSE